MIVYCSGLVCALLCSPNVNYGLNYFFPHTKVTHNVNQRQFCISQYYVMQLHCPLSFNPNALSHLPIFTFLSSPLSYVPRFHFLLAFPLIV